MNQTQWAHALLGRLGIQPTTGATRALLGWARAEGGHWNNDAAYNPLNTTQREAGARPINPVGVKAYSSWDQGLDATVATLRNGRYNGILTALRAGDPSRAASAIGSSPWGTNAQLVARAIGTGPATPSRRSSTTSAPSASRTTTRTVPGVDNSQGRHAAIAQFLGTKGADPLDFALQIHGLQDTPSRTITSTSPAAARASAAQPIRQVSRIQARATSIDRQHLPYQWGGGHQAGGATAGQPLDCSGAVSKVLGINPRVAAQFKTFGAPGAAAGGRGVTIYAKDSHVLLEINGHFWGTSAANPGGGAGWIPRAQISSQYLAGFTARHLATTS